MSDENAIFVPPSFIALHLPRGHIKPRLSQAQMVLRYELCEDLGQLLTETASHMLHSLCITPSDVLERCWLGLQGEGAVVSPDEAWWVIRRLAELMNWSEADWPPGLALDAAPGVASGSVA